MFGFLKRLFRKRSEALVLKKIIVFKVDKTPTSEEAYAAIRQILKHGTADEVLTEARRHVERDQPVDSVNARAIQPGNRSDAKRTIADIDDFVARDNPRAKKRGYQCVMTENSQFAWRLVSLL